MSAVSFIEALQNRYRLGARSDACWRNARPRSEEILRSSSAARWHSLSIGPTCFIGGANGSGSGGVSGWAYTGATSKGGHRRRRRRGRERWPHTFLEGLRLFRPRETQACFAPANPLPARLHFIIVCAALVSAAPRTSVS